MLTLLGHAQTTPVSTPQIPLCEAANEELAQGLDGWFFRTTDLIDVVNYTPSLPQFRRLQQNLVARGSVLIIIPVPGRAVANPQALDPNDPKQAAFDAVLAANTYTAFIDALRAEGIYAVDVLEAARNHDLFKQDDPIPPDSGFFLKRNIHWTATGSRQVFQNVASIINTIELTPPLKLTPFRIDTIRNDRGRPLLGTMPSFVDEFVAYYCGEDWPIPLPDEYIINSWTVVDDTAPEPVVSANDLFGNPRPQIIHLGTSQSIRPYYQQTLQADLNTTVVNLAMRAGAMFGSFEYYLGSGTYRNYLNDAALTLEPQPISQIVIWEFPYYTEEVLLRETAWRQLFSLMWQGCHNSLQTHEVELDVLPTETQAWLELPMSTQEVLAEDYLELTAADLSLRSFELRLQYQTGQEQVRLLRYNRLEHDGRFTLDLQHSYGDLVSLAIRPLPEVIPETRTKNNLRVQLCRPPLQLNQDSN
ncbi:MAG: hypothetical protein AAF708_06165 [Deinococcota bacterium]